jgi:hypothetical protein
VCVCVCVCECLRVISQLMFWRCHHPRVVTFAITRAESNGAAMPSPGTRTTLRSLLWVSVNAHTMAFQLSLHTSLLSALIAFVRPHSKTPMHRAERSERSPLAPCSFVWDANQQGQNGNFLIMLEFASVLRKHSHGTPHPQPRCSRGNSAETSLIPTADRSASRCLSRSCQQVR